LASAVKARAMLENRPNASFEDVQAVAQPVLGHRIILDYSARIEGKTSRDVVTALLAEVPARAGGMPRTLVS
jgi:MoxR-like ATPase